MLACGSDFTAVITSHGQLYTWGSSSEGQTGHGSEDCEEPTEVQLRGKAVAVACGYYHMAVATEDGALYTCGENESGKLGLDDSQLKDTSCLQKVLINEHVMSVACGGNHTAAITSSGKLFTFGLGDHGQLGHGSSCLECPTPKRVTCLGNIKVRQVTCGESHTAVITKHGNLYTCGDGRHGKLGMGEESFSNLFKLEKVWRFDGFTVQKIACGGCHTLVTAFKPTNIKEGTDSEAEAEKYNLATSVSLTKSLQDVVDGPGGYRGGLAATFPAGGVARNKRRQKNIESLGNSLGESLPPISKSNLPPLPRVLPALKNESSKEEEEKVPVNPLDMSTLPKISLESQGSEEQRDESSAEKKSNKTRKQPKDAESSSGISESEEEEDEEDPQQKKKADQTPIHKEDVIKRDDESEESLTQDESGNEESNSQKEVSRNPLVALVARTHYKKDEYNEEEESKDDEETEDDDSTSEGQEPAKKMAAGKETDVEDEEDEEAQEEESDEEDDKSDSKEQKGTDIKEVAAMKKESEDETEEEEEEVESGEEDNLLMNDVEKEEPKGNVPADETTKQRAKQQQTKDRSMKKDDDVKSRKRMDKKRKDKDSGKGKAEEEEANEHDQADREKRDNEGHGNKHDNKDHGLSKPEPAKSKEKKSGICAIL